ncbi:MAG: 2-oxoacid:acceptor oxidoreductase family protein [Eubacteriaceae bacterium]|jgi:2-oxoglutarate ferredoxin oxidoreductase subunit gamma|nr:2-oxoacid:acceptor oxidoreductase family protein [Eubacteriaceae bacterium]
MKYPLRISLCGFGGQGIVLSAVILGTAAVTKGNKYVVQTQSYGSEARGGQCQSELIIDEKPINSPIAEKKNVLIALFQDAYEKYIPALEEDGILVIDPDLVTNIVRPVETTFELPATQIAVDIGNRMTANMVVLGFLSECLGIINKDDLLEVVKDNVADRFKEINTKAVEAGIEYAKEHNMYHRS